MRTLCRYRRPFALHVLAETRAQIVKRTKRESSRGFGLASIVGICIKWFTGIAAFELTRVRDEEEGSNIAL